MPARKPQKRRAEKQVCEDLGSDGAPDVRGGLTYRVRSGHNQPGPRQEIDASLNARGVVKAGSGLPPPAPRSPAEPSGASARSSLRFDDGIGRAHGRGGSHIATFPIDSAGALGELGAVLPAHLFPTPDQVRGNEAAGMELVGRSASQYSGLTSQSWKSPVRHRVAGSKPSKPLLTPLPGVGAADKGRQEELRRSARVLKRVVDRKRDFADKWATARTGALQQEAQDEALQQEARKQGLQQETRALELEWTYNQGYENPFSGLLQELRRLGALGFPVYELAKQANNFRFGRGGAWDDFDRMTALIRAVQIQPVTKEYNPDWEPLGFSPITALDAAAKYCKQKSQGLVYSAPTEIWLPTIGTMVTVEDIVEICAPYKGPPCTITSSGVRPPGCEMVSDLFEALNDHRAELKDQMDTVYGPERLEVQARFASLRNEYGMLYCLVCFANVRLLGLCRQDWRAPHDLKEGMKKILEKLGVTQEQRRQLLEMRNRARDIIFTSEAALAVSADLADVWADLFHPPAHLLLDDVHTLHYLDIVEATDEAKYMVLAAECMVSQAALSNILSPLQSAQMVVDGHFLYLDYVGVQGYQAVEFWRFMAACFLDEVLGAWLDPPKLPGCPPPPQRQELV